MNQADVVANRLLRAARERLRSPSGSGRRLSRQELADAVNAYIWEQHRRRTNVDANYVGKLERGHHRWPHALYREAFRAVLGAETEAELGFYIVRTVANGEEATRSEALPDGDGDGAAELPSESDIPPEGGVPSEEHIREESHARPPTARSAGPAAPARSDPGGGDPSMTSATDRMAPAAERIVAAGSAIRDHALGFAAASLSPERLRHIDLEVRRLAHDFAHTPPLMLLERLLSAHNSACTLLSRTMRPAQLSALHLAAAQVAGLAATAVLDLGISGTAADLARAAYVYGEVVTHGPLRAWARAIQATVALWAGQTHDALGYVAAGLTDATGPASVRLHAMAARAWALLGTRERAIAELDDAFAARDKYGYVDEFGEEIGGEFAFGPARLSLAAAAVMLALGDAAAAAGHAADSVRLLGEAPYSQRRWTIELGAAVDLATARVLQGELEGAIEAVSPCLALDRDRRTARLTLRLRTLRKVVDERYGTAEAARHLSAAVEEFLAGTEAPVARFSGRVHL